MSAMLWFPALDSDFNTGMTVQLRAPLASAITELPGCDIARAGDNREEPSSAPDGTKATLHSTHKGAMETKAASVSAPKIDAASATTGPFGAVSGGVAR